jgi:hypothetical protein
MLSPSPLSRSEVIRTLGEVDDATIAQVIATGATHGDLLIALQMSGDHSFGWLQRPVKPQVLAVRRVLEKLWHEDGEDEYLGTD